MRWPWSKKPERMGIIALIFASLAVLVGVYRAERTVPMMTSGITVKNLTRFGKWAKATAERLQRDGIKVN